MAEEFQSLISKRFPYSLAGTLPPQDFASAPEDEWAVMSGRADTCAPLRSGLRSVLRVLSWPELLLGIQSTVQTSAGYFMDYFYIYLFAMVIPILCLIAN
ncbi:hypothetical protein [Azotobacter armeniacus]